MFSVQADIWRLGFKALSLLTIYMSCTEKNQVLDVDSVSIFLYCAFTILTETITSENKKKIPGF